MLEVRLKMADHVLDAVPRHWFSWDFTVMDGSTPLADIDVSWWREKGELTVLGTPYRVYREGLMSGAFLLESAGSIVARAEKPSAFRRVFVIEHGDRHYTLRARSAFRREFVLLDGSTKIGSLKPGLFTRRAKVVLPRDWAPEVKVFTIWLAVILWKRQADSAHGAS